MSVAARAIAPVDPAFTCHASSRSSSQRSTLCIAAVSTTEAGFVFRTRAIASSTRSLCSGTKSTPATLGFVSRYVATTWNAFEARPATFAPTSPLPPTTRSVSMSLGFQGRCGERDRLNAVELLREGPDAFDDAHLRPEPELAEAAPVDLVGQLIEARRLRRRDLHGGEHVPDRADDRLHVRVLMDRVEDEPLRLRVARGDPVRLHRVRRGQVRPFLGPRRVVHGQRPSLGREVREAIDDRVESHPDRPAEDRAEPEGRPVEAGFLGASVHLPLRRELRFAVWGRGLALRVFRHDPGRGAVYAAGRRVDELPDARADGAVEQVEDPLVVRLPGQLLPFERDGRVRDVGEGEDDVRIAEGLRDGLAVPDVALEEFVADVLRQVPEGDVPLPELVVEDPDRLAFEGGHLREVADELRPEVARAAGDEDDHGPTYFITMSQLYGIAGSLKGRRASSGFA